jgi:hypothetical protein
MDNASHACIIRFLADKNIASPIYYKRTLGLVVVIKVNSTLLMIRASKFCCAFLVDIEDPLYRE